MTRTKPDQCRNSMRDMIPWYVNGTLTESESDALREHMKICDDCRADFDLHSSMRASVLGRDVAPIVPEAKSADVFGIGRTGVSGGLAGGRKRSRWFAVAAGMAVVGVAVLLSLYAGKGDRISNQVFETATSVGPSVGIDYVLQLEFASEVSEAERIRIAAQLDGVVKWAVNDRGTYEVHVQLAEPSLAALQEYEQRINAIAGVQSAKFTALQLPMR